MQLGKKLRTLLFEKPQDNGGDDKMPGVLLDHGHGLVEEPHGIVENFHNERSPGRTILAASSLFRAMVVVHSSDVIAVVDL